MRFKWKRVAIILQEENIFQIVSYNCKSNGHLISLKDVIGVGTMGVLGAGAPFYLSGVAMP
jgi:hypothetical protein